MAVKSFSTRNHDWLEKLWYFIGRKRLNLIMVHLNIQKELHFMLGYVNLNQLFVSVDLVKATFRVNVNIMQTCLTDAFMNEIKNILLVLERSSGC